MRKASCLIVLLFAAFFSHAQLKQQKKSLLTLPIAGTYAYGTNAEKEGVGFAYIYAQTDSTILFYLDLNAGPPSLSMGTIAGKALIKNNKGIFTTTITKGQEDSCKFSLLFKNNGLVIKTVDGQYNCGFGHRVFADGKYKRRTKTNPVYYISQEGTEVYFKDIEL